MSLYERNERFRGTLFRDAEVAPATPMPAVLRGALAARANPAESGPTLIPKVLRGAAAQQTVRPFEVATMVPTHALADAPPAAPAPDFTPADAPAFVPADLPPEVVASTAREDAIRADEAAQWTKKLEEAAVRARENGYRQGYADAERAAEDGRIALREAVEREMRTLREAWQAHHREMETQMARLAFDIAEAVLAAPLPDNVRLVSTRALHEAVEALGKEPLTATLHPVDLLRVQESGIEAEMRRAAAEIRFEADPFLSEGDWHIETDSASIRRVRTELLDTLRRRLGLLGLGKG